MESSKPCLLLQIVRLFLFCIIFLLPKLASAQIDKEFWFVAPNVHAEGSRQFNLPITLRITTLASPATVTISIPANPSFTPITRDVGANENISVDLSTWVDQLQNTPANTTLDKGLLITSTADITAYYEVVSGFCKCNPEIFSLKGKNALGKEFFISSQYTYNESTSYPGTNAFDIVATTDNTHVTITPTNNIVGHNANIPFTITLNRGQTFSAVASSSAASGHLQGSYISSDNPIAVTIKDDLVQISSCADLIGDQTVPTTVLGTEYIVTKGFLQPIDNIYVMAVENNTSVYIDGNTSPVAVLAKGQSAILDLTNPNVYIRADKKIYVYHLTGNGCEAGSAIIPKLNCTGSRSVSVVRSNEGLFAVMITTKNGNQNGFTVNGNSTLVKSSDFAVVPGTGGVYVTSRIDLSGNASVGDALNFANSTGNFSLGFINGGTDDGTRYGFFSDFKSSNVESSSFETCPSSPVQLTAYGGVSYKWTPAAGLNNPNIANPTASPASTTDYTVEITTADGCVDFATVHVTVSGGITPSVSIAASANDICPGTLVTFTATPVNGGATPVYQWQVNGVNAGTNSPTFSSSALANGDKVSCKMTSSAPCAAPAGVTSNSITMNVASIVPPTIDIAASDNNVCEGTFVSFAATVTNAGSSPAYQWQVNGINAGANSLTFSSSTLANGDKVSCTVTTTSACGTVYAITSNTVAMVVNTNLPVSVSITVSQNNVCVGVNATFTATPTNGGTAPVYQWRVNGVNGGTNSPTFSSSTLTNGDRVVCVMQSNAICATPTAASSNEVVMIVMPYVTPSVNIAASANNICPGDIITFTATPVNGGAAPAYQWKVNGNNAGTNSATFAGTTFVNGDVVSCIITSNAVCPTTPTATSNSINIIVNTPVSPSVSITASGNNICSGTSVTFTATPVNGGSAPIYQWQVNGINAGTNSNVFSRSTLANNDVVSCRLTSNAKCAIPAVVPSNTLTMVVNPVLSASVSIVASQNDVCTGTNITFTATPVNGGSIPAYQWAVNGVNAGNNSATFSSSTFANGDRVTCIMTSTALCATPAAVSSNTVTMIINPYVTPSVSIAASTNNICPGQTVTFTAVAINGGTVPAYQWLLNGNNAGSNNSTFASNTFIDGDVVKCIITSSAACTTTSTATSSDISVTVNLPVSPSVTIAASNNNVCYGTSITFTATPINGGNAPAYQWLINGVSTGTNSNTFVSNTLANNDVVSCRLTSNAKCAVPAIVPSNNTITMVINPLPVVNGGGDKTIEKGNSVTLSANASGNIANVTWSPSAGLDNTTTLTPTANPEKTTLYTLTVQSAAGCVNTATVKITVLTHLIIPNTFTPNGDGINDKWEIGNLADYPDAYVKVFNRWGSEVYRSKGGSGTWDGTIKGKRLPFGTYYYVINLDKKATPISGYVALIR
ncbi:gliding motility-associated C-terminal domain-containing protein [Mucilaginibacter sp. ZT4R22]|uniref:Gliding motility-associated C-terminal domain-containing protein n=1 Tax=Mucilaginibacter pankratovii TaxID=2772110 RepID=A0ABR7WL06_9SPHI|nr:gliding motility-associated C-terminal domain-containing protein [Mucilaginibacter pankratovii]MBD1363015.1 gliding motility-associated C-terminal domain-containing protein [Mucilaginibacter pankratovii]